METEVLESVDSVETICDHPRLQYKRSIQTTPATHTGTLRLSGFHCPDCGHDFAALTASGAAADGVSIPLVSLNHLPTMGKSPKAKVPSPKQTAKPEPQTQEQRVAAAEAKIMADIGGDGPGTRLALGFFRKGYHASCQACTDLAKRMNAWGSDECRAKLDDVIVPDIMPRAKQWVANTHKVAKGVLGLVGAVVDVETPLLTVGIRNAVVEAIDEWDASQKKS